MAPPADGSSKLAEAQICEINGVSQQYRQTLVRRELVRRAPADGCTVRDARQLAAIKALSDMLPASDVSLAAKQLSSLLGKIIPGERIDVVYDRQYKRLEIARDDASLRLLVVHGRPVSVIPLSDRLTDVAEAFRRMAGGSRARRPSTMTQRQDAA